MQFLNAEKRNSFHVSRENLIKTCIPIIYMLVQRREIYLQMMLVLRIFKLAGNITE